MKRLIVLLLCGLIASMTISCKKMATKEQLEALGKKASALNKKYRSHVARWRARLPGVLEGPLKHTNEPCPLKNMPSKKWVLRKDELDQIPTHKFEIYSHVIWSTERAMKFENSPAKVSAKLFQILEKGANEPTIYKYHGTFLVTDEVKPRIVGKKRFKPGYMKGRLVIWSVNAGRFVCSSEVFVRTSRKMRIYRRENPQKSLEWSLQFDVLYKAARTLRSIAPAKE